MTSVTIPNGSTAAKSPDCGCHPKPDTCCRLECQVAPRFFCGQLLTDQDMTALVDWVRNKMRLARYRHGWGVVCGLDVRCDPKTRGSLMVSSGYAVSCCGDDIIVCKDAAVDLSKCCKPAPDPCAQFKPQPNNDTVRVGCVEVLAAELRILDLYIHYAEQPAVPTTALGRGDCNRTVSCEYTRINEGYTFSLEPAVASSDAVQAAADAWYENYKKCSDVLTQFSSRFSKYDPKSTTALDEVRAWLLAWMDSHIMNDFCFVRECICSATSAPDEKTIVEWLFWIVQDCRNAFVACECHGCDSGTGVPLARVWLRARSSDCTVLKVDPYPPYRRDLKGDCWPAYLGSVNLGRLIWHRLGDACEIAAEMGVKVSDSMTPFNLPATVAELAKALECKPIIDCGSEVVLQYFDAGNLDHRVVGFCGGGFIRTFEVVDSAQPVAGAAKDDLTKLPNIGAGRQTALNNVNITTYRQVAAMTPEQLGQIFPSLAEKPLNDVLTEAKKLAQ